MIVNCVAYQDGRKLADITPEQISDYVERPECFVWVALKDATPQELAAAQEEFGLHPLAVEDALHGQQHPKVEEYGDSLFVVLKTFALSGGHGEARPAEPSQGGAGPPDVDLAEGEVHVFVGPNYVLSVRRRTEPGFASVRARAEREPELLRQGSAFVLYALMDAIVDRYFPLIEALESRLETVEARIFKGAPARESVEALYALKARLTELQHAVRPLLEGTARLFGGRVPHLCSGSQEYFRDVYDHLQRIDRSLDGLREMVVTAVSVNLSLISLQENETTKRLASYGALIAVPTLIAGLYGMNFQHIPELDWKLGYPFALAVMATVDGLLFWRFRRARWL